MAQEGDPPLPNAVDSSEDNVANLRSSGIGAQEVLHADPVQAVGYRALRTLRRMLVRRPEAADLVSGLSVVADLMSGRVSTVGSRE